MRSYTLAILSLLALFVLSTSAMAQQHQHRAPQPGQAPGYARQMGPGMGPFDGLTEEKQVVMATLREEHRQAVMHQRLQLKAKQAELDVLLAAPTADQGKIAAVTNEITALHGTILAAQNDFRRKIFEETGRLIRGGMDRSMKGRGKMSAHGQMRTCPRMPAPLAVQAE